MLIAELITEAEGLSAQSIAFAKRIHTVNGGEELGRLARFTMERHTDAYKSVRQAVRRRVQELGGAGQAQPLFMLAADLATTETLRRDELSDQRRSELRSLWLELLAAD